MASPVSVTLVANTAANATIDGAWSRLKVVPTVSGQAVFINPSGTATVGGAGCWVSLNTEPMSVPCRSTDGATTVLSLISATAGVVTVLPDCDD